jgi:hypothetical protein
MATRLRRMDRGGLTVHGFRSTFRHWCAEATAHPREVAKQALAHALPDRVEAAYRPGDILEKRRRHMEDWAAFCSMRAGSPTALIREAGRKVTLCGTPVTSVSVWRGRSGRNRAEPHTRPWIPDAAAYGRLRATGVTMTGAGVDVETLEARRGCCQAKHAPPAPDDLEEAAWATPATARAAGRKRTRTA